MARRTLFVVYAFCTGKALSTCPASSAAPIALTLANVSIASQDTTTYGIRFDVGNPKQNLCLTPSTVVDNTLLISRNICAGPAPQNMTQAQCGSYHGGTFDLAAAGASFHNISITESDLPSDLGWKKFNPAYKVAGETNLDLISNIKIHNMKVVAITEGINFSAGHIGLGKQSVLLHNLKESDTIPSIGFGLNAGSQSLRNPRRGNLVLGGFDDASLASSFYNYPMNYSETLAGRHCPLQVNIQGLQLLMDGLDPIQLIGEGDSHAACIEPYDNLFRLSETGLRVFKQVTGWSADTNAGSNGLFLPEPGLIYPSTAGFNGSLKFTLDKGFTVDIPNSELQHPLRGLDKNGKYDLQRNVTEVNIFVKPLGAWVLGKVFLSKVYLAVDYDAQQIQLAEVNQNDVAPSPVRFDSVNSSCGSSKLAGGTIAAIVLGVVVGLALMGGAGYYLHRRRRRRRNQQMVQLLPDVRSESYPAPAAQTQEHDPINELQMQQHQDPYEMDAQRRLSEMQVPNSGYAPPSPRALPLQTSVSPDNLTTPCSSTPSNTSPPTRANEPWYVQKHA